MLHRNFASTVIGFALFIFSSLDAAATAQLLVIACVSAIAAAAPPRRSRLR